MAGKDAADVSKEAAIEKLRKRVKELKEDAATKYSEDEICQKITDVFDGFNWKEKRNKESSILSSLKFISQIIKWTVIFLIAVVFLMIIAYQAIQHNPYLSKKITKVMHTQNIAYSVARFMRIVSLPFHDFFDLKRAHKWECLVQNPFYKSEEPSCELCENLEYITSISALDKEASEISAEGEPCIIKNEPMSIKHSINYTFFREFYHKNKQDLDFSACELYGDGGIKNIAEYFANTEEDIYEKRKTFGWKNCRIEGTRALRKLFKRPSFVPVMSEIYLEKHLFFIHPDSPKKLELPTCHTANCFISQVFGASSVTLTPFDGCRKNCTDIENVEIQTGDIFYHPDQPWKITVEALNDQLSIVYRSDFS